MRKFQLGELDLILRTFFFLFSSPSLRTPPSTPGGCNLSLTLNCFERVNRVDKFGSEDFLSPHVPKKTRASLPAAKTQIAFTPSMDLDQTDPRGIDLAHEVSVLAFRFYSDKEALRLSVRRLTSPEAFNELGRPIPRGLYDPALGPVSYEDGPCITCGLSYSSCPGHFGHIVLPVSVPNPLLLKLILKILKSSCLHCPCLLVNPNDLDLLLARLYFEDAGMPRCGAAVDSFRVLRRRHLPKDIVSATERTEKEVVAGALVKNWRAFFKSMPKPLSDYLQNVGSNDVNLVEANMLRAARASWKNACSAGRLATHRSGGWKECINQILPAAGSKCPHCFRYPSPCRLGARGRLFRKLPHGDLLLSPAEIETHVETLWSKHSEVFEMLFGLKGREIISKEEPAGPTRLFVRNVLVPPSRFRPTSVVGDMAYAAEHPQNMFFQRLLTEIEIVMKANEHGLEEDSSPRGQEPYDDTPKVDRPTKSRFSQAMNNMLEALKDLYDSSGGTQGGTVQMTGIRQQLEAKSGLFRQHMMGKRVNFSCRSVIGPDVFLDTNEIGIPESFAKLLTVPEPVIPANLKQMQRAVLNGPDVYPGAVAVEDWTPTGEHKVVKFRSSSMKKLLSSQARLLLQNRIPKKANKANSVLNSSDGTDGLAVDNFEKSAGIVPKRVHRHLKTGDIVLFNRQPTLHRVSIMAHKVRILPGERTIRFHYANCGSYNADFDGDEMNVHVPQDYLARAEAEELMLSSKHYVVPTSGAPIRGLIQDHIAAATLLSQRDTFLEKEEFMQFLFSATDRLMNASERVGRKYEIPEPALFKPRQLWTGKQLISTVLSVVRNGRPGLNVVAKSKTKSIVVGREEATVIFRDGELLQGVIDKSSLGSSMYGIVHAVQETYGCEASDDFLSAMSRLCVYFLRSHGHTTGVGDLLLKEKGESARRTILKRRMNEVGVSVANSVYTEMSKGDKDRLPEAMTPAEARLLVGEMIRRDGKEAEDRLDTAMKSALNKVSSAVMTACVPVALQKSFPKNGFALMTNTGAKGSAVNSAQISCLLGSTVLEGKRVPRMGGSGSTLPCFPPFDVSPIAGGFITGRFLTGILPHEFFFHAMSGREGLLDTSLKTANSGYLQRCLVKHMEGVRLHYDYTVRDSDDSVLQFIYGDDGIDPSKSRWLNNKIEWQLSNEHCLKKDIDEYGESCKSRELDKIRKNVQKCSTETVIEKLSPGALSTLGAISEKYNSTVQEAERKNRCDNLDVRNFLEKRYCSATLEPGEAVGVVAAQGVGEPSTQMTLNTFHHAGSSSAHVTLGIPRLRELLMTASKYPKTPSMTLPVLGKDPQMAAKSLCKRMQNISLADLVLEIEAEEIGLYLAPGRSDLAIRVVRLVISLPPEELYREELGFDFDKILSFIEKWFLADLHTRLRRLIKRVSRESGKGRSPGAELYLRVAEEPDRGRLPRLAQQDEEPEGKAKQSENAEEEGGDLEDDSEKDYASSSDEGVDPEDDEDEDENRDSRKRVKLAIDEHAEEVGSTKENGKVKSKATKKRKGKTQTLKNSSVTNGVNAEQKLANEDEVDDESALYGQLGYDISSLTGEDNQRVALRWAFPASLFGKLDVAGVAKEAAANLKIAHVERITKCFIDRSPTGQYSVITEGSNIAAVLEKGRDLIDCDRLETNDMFGILHRYGVEALRSALIQEFVKVFDAYGIPVNIRHLQLIADYMTVHGSYRGFNRLAMTSTPSPFQRMTFETSVTFLTDSALNATEDRMRNPSAALAMGQVYEGGTGGFELVQRVC